MIRHHDCIACSSRSLDSTYNVNMVVWAWETRKTDPSLDRSVEYDVSSWLKYLLLSRTRHDTEIIWDRDRTRHKKIAGTMPTLKLTWRYFIRNGVVKQVDHNVEVTRTWHVHRNVECDERYNADHWPVEPEITCERCHFQETTPLWEYVQLDATSFCKRL